jgi:hypothetical protein
VRITNDHWTVCANITYPDNNPLISDTFTRIGGMPVGGSEIKGSVYAITSDEVAYIQVPWLEDGEIHVVNSMRTCVVCQKSQKQGKGILFRGEKFFFCSYAHYLSWRNQQISRLNLEIETIDDDELQRFYDYRELKIIRDNTTEEQRNRANQLDAERNDGKYLFKVVGGLALFISAAMILFAFLN